MPLRFNSCRARRTELCSKHVLTTWSPGDSKPNNATLRASVQFFVKITRSDEGQPKYLASAARQACTLLKQEREILCAPLPGLAQSCIEALTAVSTFDGFVPPVAALSR